MDLNTKLARAAWDLGPISKTTIPRDILDELINDFEKHFDDVKTVKIETLEVLNSFTVVIRAKERIELYEEWMNTFERHGYEAPFLVVDNGR